MDNEQSKRSLAPGKSEIRNSEQIRMIKAETIGANWLPDSKSVMGFVRFGFRTLDFEFSLGN